MTARTQSHPSPANAPSVPAQEFLTFRLGQEAYGMDILKVQEIRGYETPTALAKAPEFIKGVINLRGVIVPIIDLRVKFQLAHAVYDAFTVVIILNLAQRVIGVVVDSVSDVMTLPAGAIRATPEFASGTFDTRYITGIGVNDDQMLILLDSDKLMTAADMALVDHTIH